MSTDATLATLIACFSRMVLLAQQQQMHVSYDGRLLGPLKTEPIYLEALKAIETDPEVLPRLGRPFVSAFVGLSELRAAEILDGFLAQCCGLASQGTFDDSSIDLMARRTLTMARTGRMRTKISARIERLECPVGTFQLGEYLLRAERPGRCVVEREFDAPRSSSESSDAPSKSDGELQAKSFSDARTDVREIIDLIRLVRPGRLSAPVVSMVTVTPTGSSGGVSAPLAPFDGVPGATRLTPDDVRRVQFLHGKLASSTRHHRIALRRLGVSRTELDPDDRVLELMSAAEALFLSGENTESAHKLALRGAFFILSGASKRAVFKTLKAAYAVRSKVAHGDSAEKVKRLNLAGEAIAPAPFVQLVDELVVAAISRAIEFGMPRPDWDALIFEDEDGAAVGE